MEKLLTFVDENRDRYLEKLKELIRIRSVSADPKRHAEVSRASEWLKNLLTEMGMENAAVKETTGMPVVYADWLHAGNDKPTLLVYGHSDVQPEDPVEKWTTPPFEPTIRNGRLYARGADDNKGQLMTQLFALEAHLKTGGKLPVNVKVFIEGEEEGGTGATDKFVEENTQLLACDAVVISDTAWHREDLPTICHSLRGLAYFQVNVKGPNRDLHSGVYGGKIQNPLNAIAKIISQLQDENGVIQIPGYYDDVISLADTERGEFREAVGDEDAELKKDLGVTALWGEKGYTSVERNWARPSLDVNGIWGGYAGEGSKTVIAAEGGFKISSRLVANQTPEKAFQKLKSYLEKITPPGVTVDIKMLHGGTPVMVDKKNPFLQAGVRAFEHVLGRKALLVREGASIPITATFQKVLKAPPIMVGHGVISDNIHSPDESFPVEHLYNGIKINAWFLKEAETCRS